MKRIFWACAFLFTAWSAAAQNTYIAREGVYDEQGVLTIDDPRSTIVVDVKVEKEMIFSGPYARYAQKYLGVRAPLTDKTTYTLRDVSLGLTDTPMALLTAPVVLPLPPAAPEAPSHSRSATQFARIQSDKVNMTTLAPEDAAREAASTIFSLRRHRMDLVTGEAGENVFGSGLYAALREIEHMEQSYLELFLGKHVVSTDTQRYVLTPQADKRQYILCRFSVDAGILPQSDLSGDIVLLQIEPSGDTPFAYEASRKESSVVTYRIADPAECTVMCGSSLLAKRVLPLFEFGRTVRVAVPRSK